MDRLLFRNLIWMHGSIVVEFEDREDTEVHVKNRDRFIFSIKESRHEETD